MSRDANTDGSAMGCGAAAALLQRHGRWLRTVLLARSGEPTAVEELYQELAVAILRKPPVHVGESRQPAWLYGVAQRIAIQFRRRQGRRRKLLDRFADTVVAAEPADPLQWLLADERQRLVRQGLQRLSPRDRELLLLKYTEDWSYVEIADHLGLTVSAVESRLHRARSRLRTELAAHAAVEVTT